MIIAETGELSFKYDDNIKQWKYVLEASIRKKIFSNDEKDAGTVKVSLYQPLHSNREEAIQKVKGYVINGSDKDQRIKLKNEDIFEKRINDYWVEVSIVFPGVQEWSIIDLEYTIESVNINNLTTWNFQKEIPVAYSRFEFTIPEFFHYQISQEGSIIELKSERELVSETFRYSYRADNSRTQAGINKSYEERIINKETGSLSSNSKRQIMTASNVMPLLDEPFMNNKINIPSRIEFQLSYYQFPGGLRENVSGSYHSFNKELLDRSNFGFRLSKGAFAKDKIQMLEGETELTKAISLYDWIRNTFTWNGFISFTSTDAGTKAFNEGKGNVADINLTYISALREAGIKCDPVILNTRGNGLPHPNFPSFERFNYVVALVELQDGKQFMADPSSTLPFGMLPYKCRNGNGWRVGDPQGGWISMKANAKSSENTFIKINIDDEKINSSINVKTGGYGNLGFVSMYRKDEERTKEYIASSLENWTVTETQFEEMKVSAPSKHSISAERPVEDENVIYINPILSGSITENPFTREERISPVDFGYSRNFRVITQIEVPEGYSAELPEPSLVKLPNSEAKFTFTVSQNGNQVQIMSIVQVEKLDYSPSEYPMLRQFYQIVADKNNELVVLKKL